MKDIKYTNKHWKKGAFHNTRNKDMITTRQKKLEIMNFYVKIIDISYIYNVLMYMLKYLWKDEQIKFT